MRFKKFLQFFLGFQGFLRKFLTDSGELGQGVFFAYFNFWKNLAWREKNAPFRIQPRLLLKQWGKSCETFILVFFWLLLLCFFNTVGEQERMFFVVWVGVSYRRRSPKYFILKKAKFGSQAATDNSREAKYQRKPRRPTKWRKSK